MNEENPPAFAPRWQTLLDAYWEGRICEEELRELEELTRQGDLVPQLAAYQSFLASLQWRAASSSQPGLNLPSLAMPVNTQTEAGPVADWKKRERRAKRFLWLSALASTIALFVVLKEYWKTPDSVPVVATLLETKMCRWDAGTLPTQPGSQLAAGRLRLSEGIARLLFTSGAEVSLEGPADIELVDPMRCILRGGQLSAKVPERAQGFLVETPTSILKDLGTEFGVRVHPDASGRQSVADVMVFSGRVDVTHRMTGKVEPMLTGRELRFTKENIEPHILEFGPMRTTDAIEKPINRDVLQLSTASPNGKDAFVIPTLDVPPESHTDILLLIKRTGPRAREWDRMAYMGIDLAALGKRRVVEAQFSVTFAPSGLGFASQIGDARFTLYGLTDDSLDSWSENGIDWDNAPGNQIDFLGLNPAKVRALGSFTLPQGQQSGIIRIQTEELKDFVEKDSNRYATFILIRDTAGSGRSDLVHGIASRRHPTLLPPTLRLTTTDTGEQP